MGHVLVRLSGPRMQLIPHWPYRFTRLAAEPGAVEVTRWIAGGKLVTVVRPGDDPQPGDVVDVVAGPERDDWLIETPAFGTCWPDGFTIDSPMGPNDRTAFYLWGPDAAMIFPQGPVPLERSPTLGALVGPGQSVDIRRRVGDVDVIELSYEHDGQPWWQGHWLVPFGTGRVLVMTAQAPIAGQTSTRAAAETVVASLG